MKEKIKKERSGGRKTHIHTQRKGQGKEGGRENRRELACQVDCQSSCSIVHVNEKL